VSSVRSEEKDRLDQVEQSLQQMTEQLSALTVAAISRHHNQQDAALIVVSLVI